MKMSVITISLLFTTSVYASDNDLACDFEHQCYHMDLSHPDRVTPPPTSTQTHQYIQPNPPVALVPEYNPNPDCQNMRLGIFLTAQAAAAARQHCGDE